MMIRELAERAQVPAKTIRYYESVGLLPRPPRASNNYREYTSDYVERLRFIAGARTLGFSLSDISEILATRDRGIAPCRRVLDGITQRLAAIDQHIMDLLNLRDALEQIQTKGAALPLDDVRGDGCVCYLLKAYRDSGKITLEKGTSNG